MGIDLSQLGLAAIIIGVLHILLHSVMLFFYWKISSKFRGVLLWVIAITLFGFAFILSLLRHSWESEFWTIFISNLLILEAQVLTLRGVCMFLDTRFPTITVSAITVLYLVLFPIFLYVYPNVSIRVTMLALFGFVLYSLISKKLLTTQHPRPLSHTVAGVIFGLLALHDVLRSIAGTILYHSDTTNIDPLITIALLAGAILTIPMAAFSFTLLIGQREILLNQQTERELHEAKVRLAEQKARRQQEELLRDLHDGLSGPIAAIALNSNLLKNTMDEEHEQQSLETLQQLASISTREIRSIMNRIERQSLPWNEVVAELKDYATALLKPVGIQIDWKVDSLPEQEISDIAAMISFIRMIKEAIHNIMRHSGATEAHIHISSTSDRLRVDVTDNGVGLATRNSNGKGLRHMKLRAENLRGIVDFISESGLSIRFDLPLPLELTDDNTYSHYRR